MKYLKLYEDLEPFYQPKLNPKVWGITEVNSAPKIHPGLRNRLLTIAQDFYEALKVDIPIEDIQLTGSLANYTWTQYSDFDVHVMLDFSKVNDDVALVKKSLDGQRFMWNQRHPVQILGHDVELYAQDINEPHIASGLYSLLKDEWITIPRFNPPSVDPLDVSRRVEALETEIDMLEMEIAQSDFGLIQEPLISRVDWLKEKIMKARKDGLSERGEFSVENLTFKALRNSGYIEKLIDLGKEAYRKRHSDSDRVIESTEHPILKQVRLAQLGLTDESVDILSANLNWDSVDERRRDHQSFGSRFFEMCIVHDWLTDEMKSSCWDDSLWDVFSDWKEWINQEGDSDEIFEYLIEDAKERGYPILYLANEGQFYDVYTKDLIATGSLKNPKFR